METVAYSPSRRRYRRGHAKARRDRSLGFSVSHRHVRFSWLCALSAVLLYCGGANYGEEVTRNANGFLAFPTPVGLYTKGNMSIELSNLIYRRFLRLSYGTFSQNHGPNRGLFSLIIFVQGLDGIFKLFPFTSQHAQNTRCPQRNSRLATACISSAICHCSRRSSRLHIRFMQDFRWHKPLRQPGRDLYLRSRRLRPRWVRQMPWVYFIYMAPSYPLTQWLL